MSWLAQPWFLRLFIKPPLVPLLLAASCIEGFWSVGNLRILLESVSVDGMIVAGLTIVMIAGGFDLSVGAVMAMGGVAAVVLLPYSLPLAVALAICLGASTGLASGLLVTRARINPFIATLAVMVIVRGATLAYTGTRPVVGLDEHFLALGAGEPIPMAFLVLAGLLAVLHVALTTRPWGRYIFAVGSDSRAATMAGLSTRRIQTTTYVISGALAALGGVFLAARLGTGSPIVGEATPLIAAAAALIGGATLKGGEGSISGAFSGLLFIGLLINVMNHLAVPSYYQHMCIGGLLIVLVVSEGALIRLRSKVATL